MILNAHLFQLSSDRCDRVYFERLYFVRAFFVVEFKEVGLTTAEGSVSLVGAVTDEVAHLATTEAGVLGACCGVSSGLVVVAAVLPSSTVLPVPSSSASPVPVVWGAAPS